MLTTFWKLYFLFTYSEKNYWKLAKFKKNVRKGLLNENAYKFANSIHIKIKQRIGIFLSEKQKSKIKILVIMNQ